MVSHLGGTAAIFNKCKGKDSKIDFVLQVWFKNTILPHLPESTEGSKEKSFGVSMTSEAKKEKKDGVKSALEGKKLKQPPGLSQEALFSSLRDQKPHVLPGEVVEEPEHLAKILILGEKWLDPILKGEKTVELRKTRITSAAGQEQMFLGCGATIYGRCLLSPPLNITSEEQFQALKHQHCWDSPDLPYKLPFVAHGISHVQKLQPLEFMKLMGCQGRSLYRPLGWTPDDETPKKDGGTCAEEKEAKSATKTKNKKVKSATAATAKAKPSSKIKLLPAAALQDKTVAEVDAGTHFQPSESRFSKKRELLKKKNRNIDVHISGGALAHLNNVAFPRAPSKTAAYLFGVEESKSVAVKAIYVPAWEEQDNTKEWTLTNEELDIFGGNNELEPVGVVLVVPQEESPNLSHLEAFERIRGSCSNSFIFALTGSDKKSVFYRFEEEGGVKELELDVAWVGKRSLYQSHIVSAKISLVAEIEEAAKKDVERLKRPLNSSRSLKDFRNLKRRAVRADEPTKELRVTADSVLKAAVGEIDSIAEFLTNRMADFAPNVCPNIAEEFSKHLKLHPMAECEILKVLPGNMVPQDVTQAAKHLSTILTLKATLEVRIARRGENTSHTYDGNKWLKRKFRSTTPSQRKTRRVNSSQSMSQSSSSFPAASPDQDWAVNICTFFVNFASTTSQC